MAWKALLEPRRVQAEVSWPPCPDSPCWIEGRINRISTARARRRWAEKNGRPFPDGYVVMHLCDDGRCGNPDHLWAGTYADNSRDAYIKGRARGLHTPGEGHRLAKLSASDVVEIRQLVAAGARQRDVAQKYGVTQSQVSRIWTGRYWSTLTETGG